MKKTVHEVAKLTGIRIRALHYYDEIGLLNPSEITESGYRLYDENDLERLQQILFFRELDFKLKDIKDIVKSLGYDKAGALEKHKELLILKRSRLDRLIELADKTLKGEKDMSFKEFDMSEIEKAQKLYKEEAKQRYGGTDAYKESEKKTSQYSKNDWERIQGEAEEIYKAFAAGMDKDPSSKEVQELVARWQQHITKNYYNCTKQILKGLGQMYVADQRFTENIDKYGKGLAQFISSAIEIYCR